MKKIINFLSTVPQERFPPTNGHAGAGPSQRISC